MSTVTLPIAQGAAAPADPPERPNLRAWQEKQGFSFADILDIINPLQHIPLLNRAYRDITGDGIGAAAKIAGGTLFGGPIGLAASLADAAIEQSTGKDATDHVLAFLGGGDGTGAEIAADDDEYARGTDVAAITGQGRALDLELAEEDGGRWAVQVALADEAAWRQSQLARNAAVATAAPAPATVPARPHSHAEPRPRAALGAPHRADPAQPPPTPMQPLASRAAPLGTPGLTAQLPSPQMLAANPELVARARNAAGGSEAWMRLMQAAADAKGQGGAGLATATIAKAIASYGTAPGAVPAAPAARVAKP